MDNKVSNLRNFSGAAFTIVTYATLSGVSELSGAISSKPVWCVRDPCLLNAGRGGGEGPISEFRQGGMVVWDWHFIRQPVSNTQV